MVQLDTYSFPPVIESVYCTSSCFSDRITAEALREQRPAYLNPCGSRSTSSADCTSTQVMANKR